MIIRNTDKIDSNVVMIELFLVSGFFALAGLWQVGVIIGGMALITRGVLLIVDRLTQ